MNNPAVPPRYSVVVPAFNAAATIDACLRALLDQTVPRERYEVIVVDDGSTDATATLVNAYPVALLRQAHAGPASARNLGARAARGEILLFTDADCVPARDWIARVAAPLEADRGVAAVKGACISDQTALVARFGQAELAYKFARLAARGEIDFLDTYCAAVRRDLFWQAGGFDPSFPVASNEDTQFSFDLAARGGRIVFAPDAVVAHRHPESLGHYLRRKWRHGFWRAPVYRRHPGKAAGDSYTPRTFQVQFVAAVLATACAIFPPLRPLARPAAVVFVVATVPFARRAKAAGWDVALAAPVLLYLRALALAGGLLAGVLVNRRGAQRR